MEMTGLNPEHDRIIEVAMIITDKDLNVLAQSEVYVIHQSDEVLNGIVEVLKAQKNTNTVMVYASDHGESLGENGLYLHATPYSIAPKEQTHIPMIFWAKKSCSNTSW